MSSAVSGGSLGSGAGPGIARGGGSLRATSPFEGDWSTSGESMGLRGAPEPPHTHMHTEKQERYILIHAETHHRSTHTQNHNPPPPHTHTHTHTQRQRHTHRGQRQAQALHDKYGDTICSTWTGWSYLWAGIRSSKDMKYSFSSSVLASLDEPAAVAVTSCSWGTTITA
jgi:hypothetical protein